MSKCLAQIFCAVPIVYPGPNSTLAYICANLFASRVCTWAELVTMGEACLQVSEQEFGSLPKAGGEGSAV